MHAYLERYIACSDKLIRRMRPPAEFGSVPKKCVEKQRKRVNKLI